MPNDKRPAEQEDSRELLREFLKILGALCFLGALGWYVVHKYLYPPRPPPPTRLVDVKSMTLPDTAICGPPKTDGSPIVISMLYSEDMQSWVENAAERFARGCPNIQVRLMMMPGLEAAEAILKGEVDPTVFAPADDLVLRYLQRRWKDKNGDDLFDLASQLPLVRSPLVVLVWQEEVQVMEAIAATQTDGEGPWVKVVCALVPREPGPEKVAIRDMVPGRWIDWYRSSLAQAANPQALKRPARPARKAPEPKKYEPPFPSMALIEEWGQVKFVHASPTRSAAGLEAIYLMAYDYALPPKDRAPAGPREAADAGDRPAVEGIVKGGEHLRAAFETALASKKDAFRRWLRRCEAGLDAPPPTAELLTNTMFNVGGESFDGVVTYEHLVLPVLAKTGDHEGEMAGLRVLYPQPTIVNDHPVVHLRRGDPERREQHEAAERWIKFLRSTEMQGTAIAYNFRPVIPQVTIREYREKNLFLDLRRYGVSFEEALEEPPRLDGKVVVDLIESWKDATGRN